jgi:hypothetical protein
MVPLDAAKLQDLSVRRGEECIRASIEWSDPGLQGSVEEGGKIGIGTEIGLGNLVKAKAMLAIFRHAAQGQEGQDPLDAKYE